ncbi:MAG: signal recognition particle-docking protein FtsY [Pseudomonadota bacterium]
MTKPKTFLSGLFGKRHEDAVAPAAEAPAGEAARIDPLAKYPDVAAPSEIEDRPLKQGFFARLAGGLSKTTQRLSEGVAAIVTKRKLDNETLDALEELLIGADLGVNASARVRETLARDRFNKEVSDEEVRAALAEVVAESLVGREQALTIDRTRRPHVILTVGVNGAGKTTTIGKLAEKFRKEGLSVMLAAGDTFRAAAVEQLKIWGERTGATVIAKEAGADAAGLAFEALERARHEGVDVLLIDTAGRLQNRRELMDELAKIVRVLKKLDPEAPHDTLLILDATVGQNAISQAGAFREIAGVTGLVMTKLDGTARGGVLVALAEKHPLPIHFIGVGEGADDLQPFEAATFARALAGLSSLGGRG